VSINPAAVIIHILLMGSPPEVCEETKLPATTLKQVKAIFNRVGKEPLPH
jgi:hypothetical protein